MKRTTKRKSAPKKTHRKKSRRVSGIGSGAGGMLMTVAAVGGGAVGIREVSNLLQKYIPAVTPVIAGALQVAAGLFLAPKIIKSKVGVEIGYGMVAEGVVGLLTNMGVVSGMGIGSSSMSYRINGGTSMLKAINGGTDRLLAVNGAAAAKIPPSQSRYRQSFKSVI